MKTHAERMAAQEDTQRKELMARISALLIKAPHPSSIGNISSSVAYKDAAKRATAAIAKPKASLRTLKDAERDLAHYHAVKN